MPTYNYLCKECEHQFEIKHSIKDDPITECPKCCEHSLKRLIYGGSGFILKGGGWYSDLYSSKSKDNKKE